ncbi:MAG: hypothetical protein ABWY68_04135 [Cryobacterium sp.]
MTTVSAPPASTRPRRPASVVGGAALMVARTLSGGFVILTVLTRWEEFAATIVIDGDKASAADANAVLGWVVGSYALILVLYLFLVALVFTGRNWARVVAMAFASVSILFSFADYSFNGAQITLRTSLVSVTLDILILLALSSTNARHYARAVRAARDARAAR